MSINGYMLLILTWPVSTSNILSWRTGDDGDLDQIIPEVLWFLWAPWCLFLYRNSRSRSLILDSLVDSYQWKQLFCFFGKNKNTCKRNESSENNHLALDISHALCTCPCNKQEQDLQTCIWVLFIPGLNVGPHSDWLLFCRRCQWMGFFSEVKPPEVA